MAAIANKINTLQVVEPFDRPCLGDEGLGLLEALRLSEAEPSEEGCGIAVDLLFFL